ncbi:hypothetical protein P3342_010789 [Pyrenophora teres f. teres]|uniref:Glycoside hydrolase family 131 protein n=1 Tax=Pyrenophora teres f. teres TaxID=97479 RepID=A0A6S6WBZ2_9PLEO|nr:hypothetical protein PTNB85_08279 [Pyrenophora teres f. teres]KAE8830251.1 hypothetical protein HRS9139_06875 [Pyrenophora teres f. teres]KAE8841407.1 hypothetical protein HRS9122_05533 [Pyrenophora teres f. teres]KAE8859510.1 hypothetical protein PTNB29_06741 [Pyrenophora teres f. teres]KAE8864892.1 hypothetical protein PTNB73_05780 [Pyrenophora teres f. teres]
MHLTTLFLNAGLATAASLQPHLQARAPRKTGVKCPVIFDGRIPTNATLSTFDSNVTSPFNPGFVKGENRTWSSILLLPETCTPSRFDVPKVTKPFEVTIDDGSIFRAGEKLQVGFRRAGLLFKDDKNDAGADQADKGVVTFHWSIMQDAQRPLNLSHEYMNVWHEKADFSGNQFMFVGGVVLNGDGGTGNDTKKQREVWKIQNIKNEFVFQTKMLFGKWQNFAVQLDYPKNTMKVFYSHGTDPLKPVTGATPNNNTGGGQLQLGILKKPTETKTAVFDGFQERIKLRGEGQIYGGVFVEDSTDGCVSL